MSNQRLSRPWVCVAGVGLFWATTWALRSSIDTVNATVPDPAGPALADDDLARTGPAATCAVANDVGSAGAPTVGAAGDTADVDSAHADPRGAEMTAVAETAGDTAADADESPPTSQPVPVPAPAPPGNGRPGGHGAPGNRHRPGGRFGVGFAVTPELQAQAMEFLAQHAPKQASAINALPPADKGRTEAAIGQAYVGYLRIRADDPDLYAVIVNRIEVEDRIFGLGVEYRNRGASDADRARLRTDLLAQLHAWADVNLKERKLRLDRLKRTVSQAEDKLADDAAHRDRMVDDRLKRITRTDPEGWLPPTGGADEPGH